MDGRQFTIALFHEGLFPTCLRLEEPVPTYAAVLNDNGSVSCRDFAVERLAHVGKLCLSLIEAGIADAAMQVRTKTGEPVVFIGSIGFMADQERPPAPAVDPQLELEIEP